MNRTYEDMSKQELITLVTRLAKQHDEWSDKAERMREAIEQLTVKVEGMSTGYRKTIVKALREMIE